MNLSITENHCAKMAVSDWYPGRNNPMTPFVRERIFGLLDAGKPGPEFERRMIFAPLMIAAVIGLTILLRPWPLFRMDENSSEANEAPAHRNVALDFGKWVERQACARGLSVRGVARPVPLECPKCHKTSNYFVYPDELCERCWRATLKPESTPINSDRV